MSQVNRSKKRTVRGKITWTNVARKLRAAFNRELPVFGVTRNITMRAESLPGTKLHRVLVISPSFRLIPHWDRQDIVWRIVTRNLLTTEQGLISMIVALTPRELY